MVIQASETAAGPPKRGWASWWLFRRPPRFLFHSALVPGAAILLWNASLPGFSPLYIAGIWLLGLGAIVWSIRLVGRVMSSRKGYAKQGLRGYAWFAVAPVAGLLVLALNYSNVPLRARWTIAKGDFVSVLRSAPLPTSRTEWEDFVAPARIGTYEISKAVRVGDGVIFFESTGNLLGVAGFAYLPTGPLPELDTGWFENPQYFALGGGWYAWTASW